jgi:hypothetical protein
MATSLFGMPTELSGVERGEMPHDNQHVESTYAAISVYGDAAGGEKWLHEIPEFTPMFIGPIPSVYVTRGLPPQYTYFGMASVFHLNHMMAQAYIDWVREMKPANLSDLDPVEGMRVAIGNWRLMGANATPPYEGSGKGALYVKRYRHLVTKHRETGVTLNLYGSEVRSGRHLHLMVKYVKYDVTRPMMYKFSAEESIGLNMEGMEKYYDNLRIPQILGTHTARNQIPFDEHKSIPSGFPDNSTVFVEGACMYIGQCKEVNNLVNNTYRSVAANEMTLNNLPEIVDLVPIQANIVIV